MVTTEGEKHRGREWIEARAPRVLRQVFADTDAGRLSSCPQCEFVS